jgi:hypothetical protein
MCQAAPSRTEDPWRPLYALLLTNGTITIHGAHRRRIGGGLEWGALASPSAPTSTSTRRTLVNLMPCQAWHGRGLNEVPTVAIRGIKSCREAMYGGFWEIIVSLHQHLDLPLGPSGKFFRYWTLLEYRPIWGGVKHFLARGVRTEKRRAEGVGAGGGKPGSNAMEGRSLHVDPHVVVELGRAARHHQPGGLSRREER